MEVKKFTRIQVSKNTKVNLIWFLQVHHILIVNNILTDDTQSFKKFPEYEDWRDNFLRPTLKTTAEYLKNDRYLLWNIADIADGDGFMPLEKDSRDILAEYGLEYVETLKMLMTTMRGVKAETVRIVAR